MFDFPLAFTDIKEHQKNDPDLRNIVEELLKGESVGRYSLRGDILYCLSSDVASEPMEKLFVDYMGKLPRSKAGNSYTLVCVNAFSKFTWVFPLREATTAHTIDSLKSIFFLLLVVVVS